jgi:sugar (pentulose or hexulose) kinase
MHILALDVGTSSVKAAVLDQRTGDPVGRPAKAAYDLDHPTSDAAEVPPDRLWEAIDHAARKAVSGRPKGAPPVEAVGLSCLTPALVLLDAGDNPLSPIWLHLDRRSRSLARRLQDEAGDEFLRTVGTRPLPGGTSALCFAQQVAADPTLRGKVEHYLHANSWIGLRLTGERAFDPGNASFTGLFGTCTDREWSARWCDYFGVDPGWLPEVVDGSTTLGGLLPEIAASWGMDARIPVKIGTADTSSAVLAAGLTSRDLLHIVGTTQVLAVLVEKPVPDPSRLTRLLGVGPNYVYVAHNPVGGVALEWMHQLCFHDQPADEFYGKTIPANARRETEVRLDPPFLGGDRLEIDRRVARFTNLTLSAGREDLLAAELAAMRDGHRQALAAVGRDMASVERIFLTGGGAETVRHVLPEYESADVRHIEEGSLRGVARLFDPR